MIITATELTQLWSKHAASLQLLARGYGADSEDCVQEAFIRLASTDPAPNEPIAWLARVVRNLAISRLRSDRRREKREMNLARSRPMWFHETDRLDQGLDGESVSRALAKLEPESRDVIIAHLWNGLSFRQIAEAFEMTPSTVHRRYHEAIQQMRSDLNVGSSTTQQKGDLA